MGVGGTEEDGEEEEETTEVEVGASPALGALVEGPARWLEVDDSPLDTRNGFLS